MPTTPAYVVANSDPDYNDYDVVVPDHGVSIPLMNLATAQDICDEINASTDAEVVDLLAWFLTNPLPL